MRQTLIINKKQESDLNQILKELIAALKNTYSEEDLMKLSFEIIKESGVQTYNSKKDTATSLLKKAGNLTGKAVKFTKNKYYSYKTHGVTKELSKDASLTFDFIKSTPDKLTAAGKKLKSKAIHFNENFFKKTKDEKIEMISVGLMGVLIFFAAGGGEDFEGGIPDSDLNFGIGMHRHLMSHSIIMGFIVEFLMRGGIEIINKSYKHLPHHHHTFWDKSHEYINKHKGVAIGSMWAGISAHLIKDAGLLGHDTKPYTGMPFEMSMDSHENLFAANAAASGIFAYNDIKNK